MQIVNIWIVQFFSGKGQYNCIHCTKRQMLQDWLYSMYISGLVISQCFPIETFASLLPFHFSSSIFTDNFYKCSERDQICQTCPLCSELSTSWLGLLGFSGVCKISSLCTRKLSQNQLLPVHWSRARRCCWIRCDVLKTLFIGTPSERQKEICSLLIYWYV